MSAPHIFRWDLDKTYLQTEFDTVKDLIKTALQKPADKANVPGSAELLRALRTDAGGNAEIYFISGSPRQMHDILTKKLLLDGVDFEGFVLKDNLRNLMRFRFRALKEQIGYKLPALLKSRAQAAPASRETLFGDDAERDAFVYSLYADLLAERVSPKTLDDVLTIAGVYSDCRDAVYLGLDNLQPATAVERIIIHLDRRSPPIRFEAYGRRVVPVYNYFQAALVLFADGRIRTKTVNRIGAALIDSYQFTLPVLVRSFQDVLRRGAITTTDAERLIELSENAGIEAKLIAPFYRALEGTQVRPVDQNHDFIPDYAMLLRRELDRYRIEKSRRKWRFLK